MSGTHSVEQTQRVKRRILIALLITLAFLVIEALAGWIANSLALLTDAVHNLTDVAALGLSWYGLRLTLRRADAGKTFGYHRAGILIALVNSGTLFVISLGILYEAYLRFLAPPPVQEDILIGVATLAFFVNAGTAWLVRRGSENDLNVRSAFVHLAADAVSTLGAVAAGIGIALTGWQGLDALASVLIAVLILWTAWGIVRETVHILLEATPRDVDIPQMVQDMMAVNQVLGVHDLHVWSLSQNVRALSAHVLTEDIPISRAEGIQRDLTELLRRKYGIGHSAFQLECARCDPAVTLYCDLNSRQVQSQRVP